MRKVGEKVYHFDDITFIGGTTPPTSTEFLLKITFEVDMTCAEAPESFSTVHSRSFLQLVW